MIKVNKRKLIPASIALAVLMIISRQPPLLSQTKDWPFATPSPSPNRLATPSSVSLASSTPPPTGAPMRQLTWETIANRDVSYLGSQALAMNPRAWYHGETENFV